MRNERTTRSYLPESSVQTRALSGQLHATRKDGHREDLPRTQVATTRALHARSWHEPYREDSERCHVPTPTQTIRSTWKFSTRDSVNVVCEGEGICLDPTKTFAGDGHRAPIECAHGFAENHGKNHGSSPPNLLPPVLPIRGDQEPTNRSILPSLESGPKSPSHANRVIRMEFRMNQDRDGN